MALDAYSSYRSKISVGLKAAIDSSLEPSLSGETSGYPFEFFFGNMSGLCTRENIGRGRVQTIFVQVVIHSAFIRKIKLHYRSTSSSFFLYTTSKIILPTREEQCTPLLGWVFQLKWFFIGIWNKAISTPVLFSSSNNFFLLFVIMTPPHLSSVFLDIFIMSQRSCYRDSFYDSVKCWSCRSLV